jgi:riboflavin synthase
VFTGIVEELGTVASVTPMGESGDPPDSVRITVRGDVVTADVRHGDSIAVNGVCLTVVDVGRTVAAQEVEDGAFTADVMRETLDRSTLGALRPGDPVNLERAATLATRMGGHLVQGHVDGIGAVIERVPGQHWEAVRFSLPPVLRRYVVEKGSITVDGISLTVAEVSDESFTVGLIPTTLKLTTLGAKGVGDPVNLEVDVIAKYVEKLLGTAAGESA